jgi:hypothetical protein
VTRTTPEDAAISESWLRRQFVRVLVYCNTAMLMPNASGSGTSGLFSPASLSSDLGFIVHPHFILWFNFSFLPCSRRNVRTVSITDLSSLKSSLNAESPDEVALIVAAAQHCGALLTVRNGNSMESRGMERYAYNSVYANSTFNTAGAGGASVPAITTPVDGSASSFQGPTERIELLAVNEFDSDRKMMSVLVRYTDIAGPCAATGTREDAPKSRIFLLCKGEFCAFRCGAWSIIVGSLLCLLPRILTCPVLLGLTPIPFLLLPQARTRRCSSTAAATALPTLRCACSTSRTSRTPACARWSPPARSSPKR